MEDGGDGGGDDGKSWLEEKKAQLARKLARVESGQSSRGEKRPHSLDHAYSLPGVEGGRQGQPNPGDPVQQAAVPLQESVLLDELGQDDEPPASPTEEAHPKETRIEMLARRVG